MNKFLTIPRVLLLVAAFQGLAWNAMTEPGQSEPPAGPATQTTSGLPGPLEYSRFSPLGKKSPFTLASTTEEAADFAKDLVLAGFVRLEGEDFVMVANRAKPDRVLVGKKPSPSGQGMILVEVRKDPSGDPAKMEAKIKKGSETATLKYEATGGGGAPPPVPAVAGAQSGAPVPAPQVPGFPGQAQPGQAKGTPGQNPTPAVIRRRVIPIPAKTGR